MYKFNIVTCIYYTLNSAIVFFNTATRDNSPRTVSALFMCGFSLNSNLFGNEWSKLLIINIILIIIKSNTKLVLASKTIYLRVYPPGTISAKKTNALQKKILKFFSMEFFFISPLNIIYILTLIIYSYS